MVEDMTGLLDLPPNVRYRIYAAAGILGSHAYPRFINLNNNGAPQSNYDRPSFLTTHALLLTCQTLYEEVTSQVYASNTFFIRFNDNNSLEALRRLRSTSVQAIRRLIIHLNVASCGIGLCDREIDPWSEPDYDKIDKPLCMPESATQVTLSEWHRTWKDHIRPNIIQPGKLELNFICDVANSATAKLVVEPFLIESHTLLSKCNIRLSHRKDLEIQQLTERAVAAVTESKFCSAVSQSNEANTTHFRFLDLPIELRQHILQYTDLVLRWKEVEWNPLHGFYSRSRCLGHDNCYPHNVHGHQDNLDRFEVWPEDISSFACWEQAHYRGCFCKSYHSAFSSFRCCKCWAPPTSLFLVSQLIRTDALQVFFGQNRFVVAPAGGGSPIKTITASPTRLPVSVFLSDIVPRDALQHLQSLEIVCPQFGQDAPCTYCPLGSAQWHDWVNTLHHVKTELDLSKLTICVHFATWQFERNLFIPPYRRHMNEAQRQAIKECYINTIAPLKVLGGLKRFYAYLADPAQDVAYRRYVEEWEQEAEKIVMGDAYESAATGKADVVFGRWLQSHQDCP